MATLHSTQTILYEIQEACKQLSLAVPNDAFAIAAGDETALMMSSVANLAGIMINDCRDWEAQQRQWLLTGDGVRTEWDLPADLGSFVENTGWSSALRRPIVVLNAQQWAAISSWLSQSFYINPACRIYQDQLVFMSAPAAGEEITFQYRSKYWVQDGVSPIVYKEVCTRNSDKPLWDWLLMILAIKLKYLEFKGVQTAGAMQDFSDRLRQLTQKDQQAPILTLSGPVPGGYRYLDNFFNTPDTNIGS